MFVKEKSPCKGKFVSGKLIARRGFGVREVADAKLSLGLHDLKRDVGREYLYTLNFSEQTKVQFTYFVLRTRLGVVSNSSDWTLLSHHRKFAYLSPFVIGLFASSRLVSEKSPTGRIISPPKVIKC